MLVFELLDRAVVVTGSALAADLHLAKSPDDDNDGPADNCEDD